MPQLDLTLIAIRMSVLILSLSFHEAAHAWTSDRLGDPTARTLGRLTLNPLAHIDWIGTVLFPLLAMTVAPVFIGWAKPVPVNGRNLRSPRRDFAIVALAGPVSNIILAAIAGSILTAVPGLQTGTIPAVFLETMVFTNVGLSVFNMIPLPPLDGGNILAGIVPEPVARLIDQIRPYGFIVLYVLMLTGTLSAFLRPVFRTVSHWLPR